MPLVGTVSKDLRVDNLKVNTALAAPADTNAVVNTDGGAATITAAELVAGYTYHGAAGASVALTLPTVAAVNAVLAAKGIRPYAGYRLPQPILIFVTDANALTVTAGTGFTVIGKAVAVNDETAAVYIVYTSATAAKAIVVGST